MIPTSWFRRLGFRTSIYFIAAVALAAPQTRNIKDFGAKGDGSTDDSTAIENASVEVARTGGVLLCPPGIYLFNPARHKIVLGSNTRLTGGCLIRVVPESGNYTYIISARTPSTHVENVVIDGISIDQNILASGVTARVIPKDIRTAQIAILFFNVRNIDVSNTSIVGAGVDAIDCNGTAVQSVRITHNLIVFQKRTDQPYFDNSSVYVDGKDFEVSNNIFRSDAGQDAVTAIEVHTGAGAVSDNIAEWYRNGVVAASTHGLRVRGNTITHAEGGISLWGQTDSNSDSEVTSNVVSLNKRDRLINSTGGIFLWRSNESKRLIEKLTVSDNIIEFEHEAPRDTSRFEVWGIGIVSNGAVQNINVLRNTIVNAPLQGIKVGAAGAGRVAHVVIADNTVVNPGLDQALDTNGVHAGIALDGDLNDVEIRANTIACTGGTCPGYGIYGTRGNDFINVRVFTNFVQRLPGREYSLAPSIDRSN